MKKLIAVLIFLITISSVFAQSTSQNIVLPTDGWRYNLKRFGEDIGGLFRFRAEAKVEYNLQLAQNRLNELEALSETNKAVYHEFLMNKYEKHINNAEANAQQSRMQEIQLMAQIQERLQEHTQQLTQLKDGVVGEELQDKIQSRIAEIMVKRSRLQGSE